MSLQNIVNGRLTPSVIGEFSDNSAKASRAYICIGTEDARPEIGRLFVFKRASVGGNIRTVASMSVGDHTSNPCGILVNPKEHTVVGFKTEKTIPSGSVGTIAERGRVYVWAHAYAPVGGDVFVDSEGNLGGHGMPGIVARVVNAKWLRGVPVSADIEETVAELSIDLPYLVEARTEGGDVPHTDVDPESPSAKLSEFLDDVGVDDDGVTFGEVAEAYDIAVTDETTVKEFVNEFRG